MPPYFDGLIAARRAGQTGRHVHLGYWDTPPDLATPCAPGEFEAAQALLTERMIDLAPPRGGARVLDIACGFGGALAAIDARLSGMALTGLNIDRRQLALCAGAVTRSDNRLTLVAADACALPFPAAAFDHALCIEAMFHFVSREVFLAETARLLRPGGTLAVSDILLRPAGPAAPWSNETMAAITRRDYGPWPAPWTGHSDLLCWADAAGLDPIGDQDWTAATLPTYRVVSPDARPELSRQPSAGQVFRWLHSHGRLEYRALAFRRR